jgi:uncharacterized protein YdeI (YjbR/CyaY-like superfamily)
METFNNIPVVFFADTVAWEQWLAQNYTLQTGVWIKISRKASGIVSINHADALDEALCYGWIDGQRRSFDDTYFLQKFTPRRARSLWSKVNIAKVEAFIADGRMQPSGMAEIAAAKADGRWDAAYESQKAATPPPDFAAALDENQQAKAYFATLTRAQQYSFLWRLMTARKPETRARRLAAMIELLNEGKHF